MALNHSPRIITNGLVLYYDMANTKKSFKGKPTVNELAVPTPASNGAVTFQIQGTGIFYRIASGNYGGYEIQPNDVVYKYDLGLLGCHYHGTQKAVTPGVTYTFSFDYYISRDSLDYPSTNYLANIEVYETVTGTWVFQAGASATDSTPTVRGVWKTASFSLTIPAGLSAPYANFLLYPGACGNTKLASSGFILYKNPQCEINTFATPFVAGTRSNAQSIIDLTGNNTVTVSDLTYAADNTFSFDGSNDSISIPYNASTMNFSTGQTICIWLKPATGSDSARRNPYNQAYGGSGTITHELNRTFTYFFGTNGGNGNPYVGKGSGFTVAPNELAFISVTRDQSSNISNWYKNGVLITTSDAGGYATTANGSSNILIGSGYTSNFLGTIHNVQVYNRALTAAEISQNFNALRGRFGL